MDTGSISYFAAFLGGLISFLSPCVLPLVPAYLSYMAGTTFEALSSEDEDVTRRALVGSFGFVLGFSTVFVALGATASAISPLILANKVVIGYVAGSVIIILGLHYMGLFRIHLLDREMRLMPATLGPSGSDDASPSPVMQALAPYGIGLAFGFGWTPCIGPTLTAVQSLALAEASALRGALLSFGYCIGLGIPFVAFAFFIERAARATDFIRRHYAWIMRIGGGMLVLVGLLLVTGLWLDFTIWLRVTIPGFETAL